MGSGYAACATVKQTVQNSLGKRRSLRGVGSGAEFIQKNQTALIQEIPYLCEMTNLPGERGNMIIKALLIADEGMNIRPAGEVSLRDLPERAGR